ncbi:hypothetical protein [uncultured Brevibacillus sp.]|uniref:hypothetical protein n=1 Tax=uncultured Brevibacillus sp. TaxID=169970 RepID=UPI00259A67B3|nr:hypothetical protein [uncultured Brevibacillus sp.]
MEYRCPDCQQIFQAEAGLCPHLMQFLEALHGQKVWRIRFLHRYAFEFYSDAQIQDMVKTEPLNVSEVMCIDAFNAKTLQGVNSLGKQVSLFD